MTSPFPEEGACLAGYAALIQAHKLKVPSPDVLCIIGAKHKKYTKGCWNVFTPRHKPDDTLYGHLTFALKYEGIDLAVLNALFRAIKARDIETVVQSEPTEIRWGRLCFYAFLFDQLKSILFFNLPSTLRRAACSGLTYFEQFRNLHCGHSDFSVRPET
jgi:hypothetical protein